MNGNDPFSRAGDVLKNLFDRIMPENASDYADLFSGWERIAGGETAMHVVPRDIVNSALILEADHPGWIQRIRMRQEGILAEIQSKYPELGIRRIKIVIGKGERLRRKTSESSKPGTIAQKQEENKEKTPSVAVHEIQSEEDRNFFKLLEEMRRRGDS